MYTNVTPGGFQLYSNYPNPFNATTSISYDLKNDGHVILEVYNVAGQRVRTVVDGYRPAGHHVVEWNGIDDSGCQAASGVYFYRLRANGFVETKKMVILK